MNGAKIRGRRLIPLLVVALSLQMIPLAAAPRVFACSGQLPGRTSHNNVAARDGSFVAVGGLNGISSSILEYDPYYSGSNGTGTNATVLLAEPGGGYWAQLGWFKSKIDGGTIKRETGLEFYGLNSINRYFKWFGSHTVGTSTWYEILWESPNLFHYFIGGTYVWEAADNFLVGLYNIMGETHDLVDQMPGGTTKHVTFVNNTYFTGNPHTGHWDTGALTTNTTYYDYTPHSGNNGSFGIWDKGCAGA